VIGIGTCLGARIPHTVLTPGGVIVAPGRGALTLSGHSPTSAHVSRVSSGQFSALTGEITFSEFSIGTTNPVYAPGDYGGTPGVVPTVSFRPCFAGQVINPFPFTSPYQVFNAPSASLALNTTAGDVQIVADGGVGHSPVLGGDTGAEFTFPRAMLFSSDVVGVRFLAGLWETANAGHVIAYARDGTVLGSWTNNGTSATDYEEFCLVDSVSPGRIAGILLWLLEADEPSGVGIDGIRFTATPASA